MESKRNEQARVCLDEMKRAKKQALQHIVNDPDWSDAQWLTAIDAFKLLDEFLVQQIEGGGREMTDDKQRAIEEATALLQQIANGEGRFSRDLLIHAANIIEDSQNAAKRVLELLPSLLSPLTLEKVAEQANGVMREFDNERDPSVRNRVFAALDRLVNRLREQIEGGGEE